MSPYNTDIPLILFVLFLAYLLSNDEADPEGGITPHSWCGTRVTRSANRFQELFVFTNSTANVGKPQHPLPISETAAQTSLRTWASHLRLRLHRGTGPNSPAHVGKSSPSELDESSASKLPRARG